MNPPHDKTVYEHIALTLALTLTSNPLNTCTQARKAHGRNELPEDPGTPFWKLVLKQFDDYLVKILIAAAVIDLLIALTGGDYSVGCGTQP